MQPIMVTTTCDNKGSAEDISRTVLAKRLAGCVQISSAVTSLYWWEGTITTDLEYRIDIKSEKSLFFELAQIIKTAHSYDVPEIIATDITMIDSNYAAWLASELDLKGS